jgi:ribosomal protein L30/L7E
MNNLTNTENEKVESSASDESAASKDLKLIQKIIDKGSQMLEDESYFPRIQDILKAIQLREKVNKMVKEEDSKAFWDMIEEVRQEELPKMYPDENSLESLIKGAIYSLRFEVKNGIVSVKAITDAYNLGKSEESRLTYTRMGRLLTRMGFVKAKTSNGCSAIFWNDSLLSPKVHLLDEKNENLPPEAPEPPDAPEPPVG